MSDNMLSQEEIDALLNGTSDNSNSTDDEQLLPEEDLNSMEVDALGEIGNISFGSSATTLSTLLNQKVDITTPKTAVINRSELYDKFPQPNVAIEVSYTEGFAGANLFVIKQSDAAIIADLMLGGDGNTPAEEFNEIHQSAVQEAMNQMMGAAATSMSTVFSKKIDISPPSIALMDLSAGTGAEKLPEDEQLVSVSFDLKIGNLIDSSIMQLLSTEFAKDMVNELLHPAPEEPEAAAVPQQPAPSQPQPTIQEAPMQTMQQTAPPRPAPPAPNVQQAAFTSFDTPATPPAEQPRNLDLLMDIPLKVSVELGRTKRTIKEILELSVGSVVELDKLAGEPVDIHVNDKLIAKGEVVVIEENFGVRVTDILSQTDRLKSIN
ncbi:flagellar motor switch phosphatase FliY [Terribacillus saccharophilus]|uniref:Flagellar motor switch phosphatase FliY n=1 Tax=Terribacillus saccharophilus TaxID=361277 RepID=A0A268AAG8_9BACI|nr:flagellar motor switch phosphatase FliY [Terribacillus saccharophilus]PAD21110.1 flagellar motor switch phosphatase FliY [Terribacillus saccharophilus]PAF17423.1 flagellar motor switch phosphatase FliY [Terribacillus saccharophilus]PAF22191.1 flagellar motor switch phosphatase FliY [Terribacillus saccharophilus]PAF38384.1 flagellar motor switch phosphatase FliY [Terribacillus saccharophilus]PAF40141.1 flagellar motor switch phosphatase FliY [Terribacillus saccharophilus]